MTGSNQCRNKRGPPPATPPPGTRPSALGCGAGGARYQMHTRDSCDAQFIGLIARYRDGGNGQGGSVSNAKSQPAAAPRINEMLAVGCRYLCQRLPARQPHQRQVRVRSFDDDHVGRCAGRPVSRALARICLWIGGESSGPIAGTGPPFHGVRPMGSEQCALQFRHNRGGNQHYGAGIPARSPHSRDRDIDPRSMVTAMTNHRA